MRNINIYRVKHITFFIAVSIVLTCLLQLKAAQAATYYVATDGNDSYTKAQAQNISTPWKVVNFGASQLLPGDILEVRGGAYREKVDIKVNGTAALPITIRAYSQEKPILDGKQIIEGWLKCTSQEECLGNVNWQNIYYAKTEVNPSEKLFFENEEYLQISEEPNQSDPALEQVSEFAGLVDEGNNFGHQMTALVAGAAGSGSFSIADPDGFYATLFKSGEKIIIGIKSGTNQNNGEYTLVKDAEYSNGTTKLAVDRAVISDSSVNIRVENQRFFVDSDKLIQADDYWNGSRIRFWSHASNNHVFTKYVKDYIQAKHMVIFDVPLSWKVSPGGSQPDAYALQNHPLILDKPGEYYYTPQPDADNNYTVYLWPRDPGDLSGKIGISVLSIGCYINYNYGSYVTISGFTIRGYAGIEGETRAGGIICPYSFNHQGLCVKNNLVYNNKGYAGICLLSGNLDVAENNTVYNIIDGYGIAMSGTNGKAIGNNITKTQSTSLKITLIKGLLINNVLGLGSTHANGISIYVGNDSILIAGNKFIGSTLTLQNCKNLTIYNNIFAEENGGYIIADWSQNGENVKIFNNLIIGSSSHIALYAASPTTTSKNNIIDGGYTANRSYNIYIGRSWSQNLGTGWLLQEGEIVADGTSEYGPSYALDDIFENITTSYKLKKDSLAIDKGIDITGELSEYLTDPFFAGFDFYKDIEGNPRPQGSVWDIGPYEYGSSTVIYGDVSGDGKISAYDAALTAQASVGLIMLTPDQAKAADVSGDGKVSAYDAALIAQYAVGLRTEFPVEE